MVNIPQKFVLIQRDAGGPSAPLTSRGRGGGGLQPPIGRVGDRRAVFSLGAIQIRPEGWGGVVRVLTRAPLGSGESHILLGRRTATPPPFDLPAASCIVPYLPGTTCRVNEVPLMIGAVLYFQYFILFLCTIVL